MEREAPNTPESANDIQNTYRELKTMYHISKNDLLITNIPFNMLIFNNNFIFQVL